uniref:Interleukin-2 n=1 Tax=Equus asinus asinus TaxID=83772 RepID=A0A8C4MH72_EQUAS
MYKMQLLACIALTLAVLANSAPTSSSKRETQQQLKQLQMELKLLLEGVNNNKNPKLSKMLTFKINMPKKATELKHLQCLEEELKPLEEMLKNFLSKDIKELMSNINVTVLGLKGSETRFTCEYDDETGTIVEFLNKWITFCQSIFSTMT